MADDLHYVGGEWYRICDRTGFKVRSTDTAEEWNGRIVRARSWEQRNQQEFVRGVPDFQNVPDPRPRQGDASQGPTGTTTSASAPPLQNFLLLSSVFGFNVNDRVGVMLDSGVVQQVKVTGLSSTGISFSPSLSYSVSAGNEVWDYGP